MIDIFEEINLLNNEIEDETEILNNLIKYSSEILDASYIHEVDYQNPDSCLDYISFTEYSIMITENLKQIFRNSQKEIDDYKQKIKVLKIRLNHLLQEIERLSTCSIQDLNQAPIFLASEEKIVINPIFAKILTPEIISFLKDYINQKYNMKLRETELQR